MRWKLSRQVRRHPLNCGSGDGRGGGATTGVSVSLPCPCHCGLQEAAPTAMVCPTDVVSLVLLRDVLEGQVPSGQSPSLRSSQRSHPLGSSNTTGAHSHQETGTPPWDLLVPAHIVAAVAAAQGAAELGRGSQGGRCTGRLCQHRLGEGP